MLPWWFPKQRHTTKPPVKFHSKQSIFTSRTERKNLHCNNANGSTSLHNIEQENSYILFSKDNMNTRNPGRGLSICNSESVSLQFHSAWEAVRRRSPSVSRVTWFNWRNGGGGSIWRENRDDVLQRHRGRERLPWSSDTLQHCTLWDQDLLQQAYYIQPPVIYAQAHLSD